MDTETKQIYQPVKVHCAITIFQDYIIVIIIGLLILIYLLRNVLQKYLF
jgi:hypothetical protein